MNLREADQGFAVRTVDTDVGSWTRLHCVIPAAESWITTSTAYPVVEVDLNTGSGYAGSASETAASLGKRLLGIAVEAKHGIEVR